MLTTLFFDLDGTLVQNAFNGDLFPTICNRLAASAGLAPEAILELINTEWHRRDREEPDPVHVMDWDDIATVVAHRLGVACPLSLTDLCIEYAAPPHITALDNARAVLTALRSPTPRGSSTATRRLVVASRGLSKYQRPVLHGLGLADLFDAVLLPDTTGFPKSSPHFFAAERDRADLAVHTGDLYLDDVLYPMQAGLLTVWKRALSPAEAAVSDPIARAAVAVLPPGQTTRPTALIAHLDELVSVVDDLEAHHAP